MNAVSHRLAWPCNHLCRTVLLLAVLLISYRNAYAASEFVPGSGFQEEVVVDKLPVATNIAFVGSGASQKIYLALKHGEIKVFENGVLLDAPFLDIASSVNRATDRGLLAITLHPQFPSVPYVYLMYVYDPDGLTTDGKGPRASRLVRVTADPQKNHNVMIPGSELILLGKNSTKDNMASEVPNGDPNDPARASCMTGLRMNGAPIQDCIPADGPSHSVGALVFGSDGSLFISLGDGSPYDGANSLALRAQNLDVLAGKILRINPENGEGLPGNPYFDASQPGSNRSKVWARGLRNPFRLALHPTTQQPFVGDVGSSTWEEINSGKGGNFGWPCYEGGVAGQGQMESGITTNLQQPSYATHRATSAFCKALYAEGQSAVTPAVFAYKHPVDASGEDLGSATAGLAFYTGTSYPSSFHGSLFIADYARQWIRYLTFDPQGRATAHDFAREVGSGFSPVQLMVGPDTNLYVLYVDLTTRQSQLRRIRYVGGSNTPPVVIARVDVQGGGAPLTVNFSSAGTGDPDGQDLSYTWSFGDGASSSELNPSHTFQSAGLYQVKLTVKEKTAPFAESQSAVVLIRVGVEPPMATITAPSGGRTFRVGDVISFEGHGKVGDQPVPPESLTWSLVVHHNEHEHLLKELTGSGGTFDTGEHADGNWYELCLTVVDGPLSDLECVEIRPETTDYTFRSDPPGLPLVYTDEEVEVYTPHVAHPTVRSNQTIVAKPVVSGRTFVSWSDGVLTPERSFTVGEVPTEFTALYTNLPPVPKFNAVSSRTETPSLLVDASASSDPEGEALDYSWRLGNEASLQGKQVRFTFRRPGTYPLALTVRDALGAAAVTRSALRVSRKSILLVCGASSLRSSTMRVVRASRALFSTIDRQSKQGASPRLKKALALARRALAASRAEIASCTDPLSCVVSRSKGEMARFNKHLNTLQAELARTRAPIPHSFAVTRQAAQILRRDLKVCS